MKIYPSLLVIIFLGSFIGCAKTDNLPNYQQQRDAFLQERMKKPSPFTADDMRVMKTAGEKLAKQLPEPGLKLGSTAPDFTLPNAYGKQVTLSHALKKGPVVLVFYRGAWCPFCNLHLHALQKSLAVFKNYNAQLITITPQKPDKSVMQLNKDKFEFEVLSDLNNTAMKAYNMLYKLDDELVRVYKKHGLDVEGFNGKGRNVLPVPGTFVIDMNGIIRGVHADVNYKERMEPAAIIEILKTL